MLVDNRLGKSHIAPMPRGWDPAHRQAIGQRILWARELVEPNRAAFARAMGVHTGTIRNIEGGKRGASIALLQDICHSLRISYDYVVEGRLIGVDAELAALLVAYHPELLFAGTRRKGATGSTSQKPSLLRPSWTVTAAK